MRRSIGAGSIASLEPLAFVDECPISGNVVTRYVMTRRGTTEARQNSYTVRRLAAR